MIEPLSDEYDYCLHYARKNLSVSVGDLIDNAKPTPKRYISPNADKYVGIRISKSL